MILSIFSNSTFMHLAEIFIWMLGAFLIGLFFGRLTTSKSKNYSDETTFDYLNLDEEEIPKIRATKTFERGGKEMIKTVVEIDEDTNALNFKRIGAATETEKDDLKKIKGIGSIIEQKLNAIGIYTYQQISNFNSKDIEKITDLAHFSSGRIERYDWVGQAFNLVNSKNKQI